jgi:chemotaxis protein MotA
MSIGTLVAAIACIGMFIFAIYHQTDNFSLFWDMAGLILVLGGTLGASFIGYQARYVLLALKEIGGLFIKSKVDRKMLTVETGKIIRWGYLVKKSGLLTLEREIKGAKRQDHFLNYGIELVISGYTGSKVRSMLNAAADGYFQRGMVLTNILNNMGSSSPAFGLIGTLVALVIMLASLASNPDGLGAAFSLALLTTLYGVSLARFVFLPAASKYQQKLGIMRFRNFLVTEGFALLADHKSPRNIQDKMNSYLDPAIHYKVGKGGEGAAGGEARQAAE